MKDYGIIVSTEIFIREAKDEEDAIEQAAGIVSEMDPDEFDYKITDIEESKGEFPNPDAITDLLHGWWF